MPVRGRVDLWHGKVRTDTIPSVALPCSGATFACTFAGTLPRAAREKGLVVGLMMIVCQWIVSV